MWTLTKQGSHQLLQEALKKKNAIAMEGNLMEGLVGLEGNVQHTQTRQTTLCQRTRIDESAKAYSELY